MKPGSVSTVELRPILKDLIQQRYPHTGLMGLADKAQLDESLIRRILSGETTSCEFDTADRILCALGSPMAWYSPELEAVYVGVSFMQECAFPSCYMQFAEKKVGSLKRYCSPRCRKAATDVKRNRATGERHRQRNRCLKGHNLTPENTATFGDGRRACKKCRRVKQAVRYRERYQSDPVFAEKQRARARDYDHRKRGTVRDLRDPDIVGTKLLLACAEQPEIQPSVLADRNGLTAPDWTGDGLMSNDPELHHSRTSQVGNERIAGQA